MIFLEILKIIGIVIGCILGFVLAVLLILLFSPICYRGKLIHSEDMDAEVKVWHPYGLFSALVKFKESKLDYRIRVLWIPIGDKEYDEKQAAKKAKKDEKQAKKRAKKREAQRKKRLKQKAKEAEKRKKQASKEQQESLSVKTLESKTYTSDSASDSNMKSNTKSNRNSDAKGNSDTNTDNENNNSENGNKNKKSIFKRLEEIYNDTKEKINHYLELLRKVLKEVNDKHNQGALVHVLKMIGIPVKYFFNKKLKVYIKLGMDDPATTGEILGVAYAAAAMFGLNLVIEPDFENKVFELDAGFKGRVFIISILIWALKIYKNKDVKIVIEKFI